MSSETKIYCGSISDDKIPPNIIVKELQDKTRVSYYIYIKHNSCYQN